jgi:hypothetical protein
MDAPLLVQIRVQPVHFYGAFVDVAPDGSESKAKIIFWLSNIKYLVMNSLWLPSFGLDTGLGQF